MYNNMKSYSLDPNRPTPFKVIDYIDECGREGVYSGSYEDCQNFISEQSDGCVAGLYDIVPNPYYKKN